MSSIGPGLVEGLSNEAYHSQTNWLSSSQLKALLPEQYKSGGSQQALDFGSLFHTAVLEPDHLKFYVALDPATVGVKVGGSPAANPTNTKAWQEAVAQVEADGLDVVDQCDLDRALRMRDAISKHVLARELIFETTGTNEESAFWIDEHGVQHKARFDRRIPGALVDLKSTAANPGAKSLTKVCLNYGYDLSAAHYLEVANGLGLGAECFVHVWVEKSEPYRVTVTELDEQFIKRGIELRAQALERAANKAEPYEGATGRLTLFCPIWALPFEDDDLEIA